MTLERSPISKGLLVFWSLIAVALWTFMTRQDTNLLISLCIAIWFVSYLLHHLNAGALRAMRKVLQGHWTVSICLSTGLVTSVMFTSIIAGDWSPEHKISSACIGPLHIHHWAKGLALCAWHARLCGYLFRKQWGFVFTFGSHSITAAIVLMIVSAAFLVAGYGNMSLRLMLAGVGIYVFMLGTLCRTDEVFGLWFKRYLALSLGIAIGITASGAIEVMRDFVYGGKTPETLIFWNFAPDPSCNIP